PLLQLGPLVDLARRLDEKGSIRSHDGAVKPDTSFVTAPQQHPAKLSPVQTIEQIEKAGAWMALHHVQQDDLYRRLVDEILDEVRPRVEKQDPGMFGRAGWIFVTSPHAVTPYHMDHEHNFILQCLGNKTLHVWDPLDRDVVTERSLELFHTKLSRELVLYKEEHQPRAHTFALEPGMGGYMPSTSPHWVKNGDGVSITISCTYYTKAIRRRKLLHRGNHKLREWGLNPAPVGASAIRDGMKEAFFGAGQAMSRVLKRQSPRLPTPPYAGAGPVY
ncbi:MAG TPA: hypothetical protein VND93_26740, partial [Myxococcales bacterium]|nr:hypothetical protein [Myxococcales bacterium]